MRLIKVGLANIDTTVGAFDSNMDKVWELAHQMAVQKCTIGAFQEQVIGGYAAEDLVHYREFVDDQRKKLLWFAKKTLGLPFPTVFVLGLTMADGGNLYNVAAVVSNGKVLGVVPKEKLPTYGVFYENRTLSHGIPGTDREIGQDIPFGDFVFDLPFGKMAVEVCEDIWSPDGPMRRRAYSGAEVIVNISSSPFRAGVTGTRREMISTRASDNQVTVVYVNQVGGQDSLVYDGGGFVNQNGRMMLEVYRWCEGLTTQVVNLDRTVRLRQQNTTWRTDSEEFDRQGKKSKVIRYRGYSYASLDTDYAYPFPANRNFFIPEEQTNQPSPRTEFFKDLTEAMIWGLKGYFEKSGAFERIVIGLSGGKDSALVLMVAWLYAGRKFAHLKAAGKRQAILDFIHCYSMPSRFNSDTTRSIAEELTKELGVSFVEVSIQEAFDREIKAAEDLLVEGEVSAATKQNIQARIRGLRMWSISNSLRGLWIQTSNMSEKAVGYTTIGGDMMGSYSLIANLPKTVVIELLKFIAKETEFQSLKRLVETKASAELAENQEDEKDLMPFPVLDALLELYAGEALMPEELYEVVRSMWTDEEFLEMRSDFKPEMLKAWVIRFIKLFQGSIFKWVQTPQTVHLGSLDLDRERALQLPVIQSREWLKLENLEQIEI